MVKVKVCGITNLEDALKSIEFGADALGFNFYPPSPRYIPPDRARAILAAIPRRIDRIALFVNEPRVEVESVISGCLEDGRQAFSGLQFHGEESPDYCRGWRLKVIKAFRLKGRESLVEIGGFPADYYLLDSWAPGYGGSGSPFSWDWLEGLKTDRVILAGGLDSQNVREVIRRFRPFGVDVCTGVETRPGVKDHGKLKDFIYVAKASA